jgi:hypothetical protein
MREALAGSYDGVSHLVIAHERRWQFRWFSVVQLLVVGVCLVFLLPVILYVRFRYGLVGEALETHEDLSEEEEARKRTWRDSPTSWFYSYWHEVRLRGFRPDRGAVPLFEAAAFPSRVQEEQAIVAAVLELADAQGLVVKETVGTADPGQQDNVEFWFGGQPLLARPEVRHESQAVAYLRSRGLEIHEEKELLEIRWAEKAAGRAWAAALLVVSPVMFLLPGGRNIPLRDLWGDLLGKPPRRTRVGVRPEGLEVEQARGGSVSLRAQVSGRELLGITFSRALGHDRAASFEEPSLRLICRGGRVVKVSPPALGRQGWYLRDLLIAATLRLRRARPELGLPAEPQRLARCHRCATPYLMAPGMRCLSCGVFPGEFA